MSEYPATFYDYVEYKVPGLRRHLIQFLNSKPPTETHEDFLKLLDEFSETQPYLEYQLKLVDEIVNTYPVDAQVSKAKLRDSMLSDTKMLSHVHDLAMEQLSFFSKCALEFPSFWISDGLAYQLSMTDLTLKCQDIYFPFPRAVFIYTAPEIVRSFAEHFDYRKGYVPIPDDATLSVTAIRYEDCVQLEFQISSLTQCCVMLRFSIDMHDDLHVLDAVAKSFKSRGVLSKLTEAHIDLINLFFGSILYINSKNVEKSFRQAPSLHPKKKKKKAGTQRVFNGITKLGNSIQYAPAPKSSSESGFSEAKWVRGHWRTFRSERYVNMKGETVWIEPFRKNVEISSASEYRKYKA